MKKTIYICNRCNQEIRTEMARISLGLYDVLANKLEDIAFPDNDIHFCIGCAKKVMEEILRPPEAGDEDGPEEPPVLDGKHSRLKKEERLDAGKVMALHRAGWDDKKIADEMGATERQIYQCIRYQEKKASTGSGPGGKEKVWAQNIRR